MMCWFGFVLQLVIMFIKVLPSAAQNSQESFISEAIRHDTRLIQCDKSQMKMSFANIDYTFAGYDVVMGYPLSIARDPGFRNAIFKADYATGKPNGDCRYVVPKGITAVTDVSCDVSFSSDIIKTKSDFFKSLGVSANIKGGGFGFEFSASASYQKTNSELASRDYVYVISKATCTSHFSMLEYTNPPPFSDSFIKSAKKIADADAADRDALVADFIDNYGTHFLDEVTFGSSYTQEHKMTTDTFKEMNNEKFGVAVQAGYSGMVSVGGGFSLDSEQSQAVSSFSKKVETSTVTVGSAPPSNGDAMTWASATRDDPVPIKYSLRPITELFTDEFMKDLNFDHSAVKEKLANAPKISCENHQEENPVLSCDEIDDSFTKDVVTIQGGYPHRSDTAVFEISSDMTCEVLCKRRSCIGYYSESPGTCSLLFDSETHEYEWKPSSSNFYLLPSNMINDLVNNNYVPEKLDESKTLYAYKFPVSSDVGVATCTDRCKKDTVCKAMLYDGTDCVIYDKIKKLPSVQVASATFKIFAK